MIQITKATNPWRPDCGDLLCANFDNEKEEFLEIPPEYHPEIHTLGQVLPLALIRQNCWDALKCLDIDASNVCSPYVCPYTRYNFYATIPTVLISDNLAKYTDAIKQTRGNVDYVLDFEFHEHMHKEARYNLTEIGRLLIGSGYTGMTNSSDGSGEIQQTFVNLDNGDKLWVHTWMWYNK